MGASGSGKSTLMNMIGALDRPTGGNYLLDGIDVSTLDRDALADVRNEKIGFVFQGFNLLSRTSALENVEMPMLYNRHRIPAHEQRDRALRALELVGLSQRADHHPNQLSGGQQQRVAIARALVNRPALLLADEPTGNLDSQTSIEVMGVFQKLNDQGITIVMVTHELDVARFTRAWSSCATEKLSPTSRCRTARLRKRNYCSFARPKRLSNLRHENFRFIKNRRPGAAPEQDAFAADHARHHHRGRRRHRLGEPDFRRHQTSRGSGQQSGRKCDHGFFRQFHQRGDAGRLGQRADADGGRRAGDCPIAARARRQPGSSRPRTNPCQRPELEHPSHGGIAGISANSHRSIASGTMFTDQDVRSLAKSAVIGKTVADQLFPGENPLGQVLRIRNIPFQIIGVLASKGFNLFGQDQDDVVVVPYTSHMHRITTRTFVSDILAEASSDKTIIQAQSEITDLLTARHRSKEPDFTVRNQADLMERVSAASRTMGFLLAGVAAVSLVVGGIGIMNIMLVSVTERTREIGIRMAVGARAADILVQFLIEALTLSAIGGSIGIIGGVGFSETVAYFKDMPTVTPVAWIAIAFVSSAIIGIISGFYPAWKASQLDPIDALRYE